MASHTLFSKIFRASTIVAIAHLLLKFSGLIQARCATQFLGAEVYEPVMVIAFAGVLNTLFLIGQELIHPSFLSIFLQEKEERGEQRAWDFANTTLSVQTLLLIAVSASIACFPDFYISLFTNWTVESHGAEYRLLRRSLQVLAPAMLFLSLGSTTYVILNGYKKFFLSAFGDASTKICIIIGLLVGAGIYKMDYRALLLGIVVGSVAKVGTHLVGLWGKLHYLRWRLDWKSPAFRAMLWLMLPLLAGVLFAKVRDNFNNIYILTHLQQSGVLMANDLGRRLYSSIQWLVPYSLQIALYPFLCEMVSKNDREKLGEVLGTSCGILLMLFIPAAIILSILSEPIAVLGFYGGKTGLEIAQWAGLSMCCYTLVLPASAVECVLMQGFFADRRMVAVTIIGIVCSSLSVLASWIFIVLVGVTPEQSLVVVALGFTLSRYLKSLILTIYMNRKVPLVAKGVWKACGKTVVLALLTAGATYLAYSWCKGILPAVEAGSVNRVRLLLQLCVGGGAGALVALLGNISAIRRLRNR